MGFVNQQPLLGGAHVRDDFDGSFVAHPRQRSQLWLWCHHRPSLWKQLERHQKLYSFSLSCGGFCTWGIPESRMIKWFGFNAENACKSGHELDDGSPAYRILEDHLRNREPLHAICFSLPCATKTWHGTPRITRECDHHWARWFSSQPCLITRGYTCGT